MSNVVVVREAFDWLEARPDSSFTEEDMKELIAYMSRFYPKLEWLELGYNRVKFINIVGTIRLSRVQIDFIKEDDLVHFESSNPDNGKFDAVYDKKSGIFLFQPFHKDGQLARIVRIKRDNRRKRDITLQVGTDEFL